MPSLFRDLKSTCSEHYYLHFVDEETEVQRSCYLLKWQSENAISDLSLKPISLSLTLTTISWRQINDSIMNKKETENMHYLELYELEPVLMSGFL